MVLNEPVQADAPTQRYRHVATSSRHRFDKPLTYKEFIEVLGLRACAAENPKAIEAGAPTVCMHAVSGSISLPFRGSFYLSFTVLVHYRSITSI
jgi:hypothetical protein